LPHRGDEVPKAVAIKYRAFLSYSHADAGWAKWLHARLEGFRFDKDLVGRETQYGAVPNALSPIFRDRNDFSGGDSLIDATIAALDASAALIVLCSPIAASRPSVNEEVRIYRARHPDRPTIPVMIGGTWPENFPLALRFELDPDGSVSGRPITILGPDLREDADGKSLGFAKLVSGLTGLSPDDLYRRAERTRRRQNRLRGSVGAAIVALAVAAGGVYWQFLEQKRSVDEVTALVNRFSGPDGAAGPAGTPILIQAIKGIMEGPKTDPRNVKARKALEAGDSEEAAKLSVEIADSGVVGAAERYRSAAAIYSLSNPGEARELYAKAATFDPTNVPGMLQNGWFQQQAGQLDTARAAYTSVLAMGRAGQDDEALIWAQLGIGDIQSERGDSGAALTAYQAAEAGKLLRIAWRSPIPAMQNGSAICPWRTRESGT
jgi:hypothetical protein